MNKLESLGLGIALKKVDISKMERQDQFAMLDNIIACDEVFSYAQKLLKASKDNSIVDEKLQCEEIELDALSEKAIENILVQDIDTSSKALIYKYLKQK